MATSPSSSSSSTSSVYKCGYNRESYDVYIESPEGIAYRIMFGCVYLLVCCWCIYQYLLHGYTKNIWTDNRQIVVLTLVVCTFLRGLQFLLKAETDCHGNLKWIDELFTFLEVTLHMAAFVLLVAFWAELQVGMKQGLRNLSRLKRPTGILIAAFSVSRFFEFIFLSVSEEAWARALVLFFKGINTLIQVFVMICAAYWGFKLLTKLKSFAQRGVEKGSSSLSGRVAGTNSQRDLRPSSKKGKANVIHRSSSETSRGSGHSNFFTSHLRKRTGSIDVHRSKRSQMFRDKFIRMTWFILAEVITVVIWAIVYVVLFIARSNGDKGIKATNPRLYLSLKYVEKACEFLTIAILCFLMLQTSRTKKAKEAVDRDRAKHKQSSAISASRARGGSSGTTSNEHSTRVISEETESIPISEATQPDATPRCGQRLMSLEVVGGQLPTNFPPPKAANTATKRDTVHVPNPLSDKHPALTQNANADGPNSSTGTDAPPQNLSRV